MPPVNPEALVIFAFTLACAILPSLVLLGYFYRKDVNPEPRSVLTATFLLGVLTVFPFLLLGEVAPVILSPVSDPSLAALVMAFGLAAIPEEFFKFLERECSRDRGSERELDRFRAFTLSCFRDSLLR